MTSWISGILNDRCYIKSCIKSCAYSEKRLIKKTRIPVISTGKKYYGEPY